MLLDRARHDRRGDRRAHRAVARAAASPATRSGTRSRRRAARDLVLELDAAGDLDAAVDVFRRDRSQLSSLACGQTDRRGRLTLDFDQPRNAALLVRVAARANSASDAFSLRVVAPDAPERPPGRALGASGAPAASTGSPTPTTPTASRCRPAARTACTSSRASAAWPRRCTRPGTSLVRRRRRRAQLRLRRLLPLHARPGRGRALQRPGARAAQPPRRAALPPAGRARRRGRHRAGRSSSPTTTACAARCAGAEPTWSTCTGSTCGARASSTCGCGPARASPFNLQLVGEGGRRISCACGDTGSQQIRLRLEPGRYFAAVRSRRGAERPLPAVAPDAHDHPDAGARRTASASATVAARARRSRSACAWRRTRPAR